MKLSIVVILHNMQREAPRTLYSLGPAHQQGVADVAYEIIVIDNGSSRPLDPAVVAGFGPDIRYHFHDTTSVSPVGAVNLGAGMARGEAVAVIVDGARMASPGLVRQSLAALRLHPAAFVCALSWHLGPDIQPVTIQQGYDQTREDALLDAARWQEDGYRLFDIATIAPSSAVGFLGGFPSECSWFCMPRAAFHALGGFNPAFRSPGGGLCNHEFRNRALRHPDLVPTMLLGEGVFHQVHGGAATNAPPGLRPHQIYAEEYRSIFGSDLEVVQPADTVYLGGMPGPARRFVLPERG
jgi:glycosyltransferase involved in cell wall biosynthesis